MEFSEREAAVYDRQLRLWGAEAQLRMKQSRILFWNLDSTTAEVAKNLVLSGFNVTICDGGALKEKERELALLLHLPLDDSIRGLSEEEKERATVAEGVLPALQALNPLADTVAVDLKEVDVENDAFWRQFRVVVASFPTLQDMVEMGDQCRRLGVGMYGVCTHGEFCVIVSDMGAEHVYILDRQTAVVENEKNDDEDEAKPAVPKSHSVSYPTIREAIESEAWADVKPKFSSPLFFAVAAIGACQEHGDEGVVEAALELLRSRRVDAICGKELVESIVSDWNHVSYSAAAVSGGELALDIIRTVSGKGEPACNIFAINSRSGDAAAFRMPPITSSAAAAEEGEEEEAVLLSDSESETENHPEKPSSAAAAAEVPDEIIEISDDDE